MSPEDRAEFIAELRSHMQCAHECLTEEERQYVKLAIQKQSQSIKLRQAIIEKTLTALLWSAIVFLGSVIFSYLTSHGWKP